MDIPLGGFQFLICALLAMGIGGFSVYLLARLASAGYFASKMEYEKRQDRRLIEFQRNFLQTEKDCT